MINRDTVVAALQAHPFATHGVELTFGTMEGNTMQWPWPTPGPTERLMAGSRKIGNDMIAAVIEEVQSDLDALHRKHPQIKRYGIWYHQAPVAGSPSIIRYAKAVA